MQSSSHWSNLFFLFCPTQQSRRRPIKEKLPSKQAGINSQSIREKTHLYRTGKEAPHSMFYDLNLPVSTSTGSAQAAQEQLETRKRVELLVHRMFTFTTYSWTMDHGPWIMGHGDLNKNALLTAFYLRMKPNSRIPGCRIQLRTHRENTRQPCKGEQADQHPHDTKSLPMCHQQKGKASRLTNSGTSIGQPSIETQPPRGQPQAILKTYIGRGRCQPELRSGKERRTR